MFYRIKIALLQIVLLQVLATSALKCFECSSSNTEQQPTCDKAYWKQLDRVQWDNLSVICLDRISAFCSVTWLRNKEELMTTRGCMSKFDSQGVRLNVGCIDISDNEKTCLCQDDMCNYAPQTAKPVSLGLLVGFSIAVVFIVSWLRLNDISVTSPFGVGAIILWIGSQLLRKRLKTI